MAPADPSDRPHFARDERGAIMIVGVFMACFLIGALWSIVGLGDMLVYRDKVQEAADHTAFSSATVHARGMNFMAALNLVMLAIVAVYLVIDLIDKVLFAIMTASEIGCDIPFVDIVACPIFAGSTSMYEAWHPWRNSYYDGMQPVLIGLSWTQTVTAMTAPYGGLAAGAQVANDYGEAGITLSTSMIPSYALTGGLANGSYDFGNVLGGNFGATGPTPKAKEGGPDFTWKGIDQRIGLPVTNESMNKLCAYSADYAGQWMEDWLKSIPLFGKLFDIPGVDSTINGILASSAMFLSCNEYVEGFWGRDGPKRPYWGNGSDWHQVFGIVFPGTFKDVSDDKVAKAMGPKLGVPMPAANNDASFYVAQAEFYFDCDAAWTDDACNSFGTTAIPRAMYSMRWMARLRRVHYPNIGGMFIQWLGGALTSSNVLGPLKGKIATSGWYQKISGITSDLAKKYGGSVGGFLAGGIFGDLAKGKDGAIVATGNGGGLLDTGIAGIKAKIPNLTNPPATGMLH